MTMAITTPNLVNINELLALLPVESQSFYQDILNKEPQGDIASFHSDVFSVINYELVLLSLQKKDGDITSEDLKQLLPWVMGNKEGWEAMLDRESAQSIYSLLPEVLVSRKKILVSPIEKQKEKDLELFMPRWDLDELNKVLQKHGSLKKFPAYILDAQCNAITVESGRIWKTDLLLAAIDSLPFSYFTPDQVINQFFETIVENSFYKELSTQTQDSEFKKMLLKAMRMSYALSSINEKLEVTHGKLAKIIKMLDPEIRKDFENRDTNTEPKALFVELKDRLNKINQELLVKVQQIKEQQERDRQAQALKAQQAKERHEQMLKEQQEKERLGQALREKQAQEKLRQAPLIKILGDMHFGTYMNLFNKKAKKFKGRNTEAHNAACTLLRDLSNARDAFLESDKAMGNKKADFKNACLKAIEKASGVLEQHRGWKESFAQFISVVMSLLTVGIVNCATGRGLFGLFPVKTDSKYLLDNFEGLCTHHLK